MTKIIQKTLTGEEVNRTPTVKPVPLKDIIFLPIIYLLNTLNLRKILFLLAFLTYGLGDGVTAIQMMDKTGVSREVNPIVRFMYTNSGKQGVITLKVWIALVILFLVWIISRKTNLYWTINGFLFALTIGGVMAVRANLMAAYGMSPPSPGSVISTFLVMVILFVMIGDLLDKLYVPVRRKSFN